MLGSKSRKQGQGTSQVQPQYKPGASRLKPRGKRPIGLGQAKEALLNTEEPGRWHGFQQVFDIYGQ